MSKTITKLIINRPHEEPSRHWSYDQETGDFNLVAERRKAGYIKTIPRQQSTRDPGEFVEIPLVNKIRPRIKAWEAANYEGATSITRRLLEHWEDREQRDERRFFFCQLEAIKTLIWLTEGPADKRVGVTIPSDGGNFERWCSKMATGSGKTVVMSMIIAWQVLNKVAFPRDTRYSKYIFAVAPNLTVRERLQVLKPSHPRNYYEAFNIVPDGLMDQLRQATLVIENWHTLQWETQERINKRIEKGQLRSVDRRKRVEMSKAAYVRSKLGALASAKNIIVLNDEAHHAWRVNPRHHAKGIDKASRETATIWVSGLDRIHEQIGILRCFDLSATPFAPSGKQSEAEALFPWVVSDFGLNDAIESGLVKTPRVTVPTGTVHQMDGAERLYHLYHESEIKDNLNRRAAPNEPLPDLLRNAYYLLGTDWKRAQAAWADAGHPVPPVMMTVTNRTETAARLEHTFKNSINIEKLFDPQYTLRIDSDALKNPQDQLQRLKLGGDGLDLKTQTKQQQRDLLQKVSDTVGKVGELGEHICNVISVGMLSEGWDTQTVTHIMGLRAFSSQLLCEQVIGRGLRRVSYEANEDGYFEPEYVNIFGVPFSFLPHEESQGGTPKPPEPRIRVGPVSDKLGYLMTVPNIARLDYTYRPTLGVEWDTLEPLYLDPQNSITNVELGALVEGRPSMLEMSEIQLQELVEQQRLQTLIFKIAQGICSLERGEQWQKHQVIRMAQLVRLVQEAFDRKKIRIKNSHYTTSDSFGQVCCMLHLDKIVRYIWNNVHADNIKRLTPVYNKERPQLSTAHVRSWHTKQNVAWVQKSHISHCVYKGVWEKSTAYALDQSPVVAAFVKNDHFGFNIHYLDGGIIRRFKPDYIVRLTNGDHLILVLAKKRVQAPISIPKQQLDQWVEAVNNHKQEQHWDWHFLRSSRDLGRILETYRQPTEKIV